MRRFIVFLFVMIVVLFGILFVINLAGVGQTSSPAATRRPAATRTPNPYTSFIEVRNNCGACGTSSPVGGWEAVDGRAFALAQNGNYTIFYTDGTSQSGTWELSGRQLCFNITFGSASSDTCFNYQQKIDAMKLDDAIYIRR